MAKEAILFSRCLGINDSGTMGTQFTSPSPRSEFPGATEIVDCSNVTIGADGALESVPGLATVLTHTAPVTAISAGKRLLYSDDIDTLEWNGTASTKPFPLVAGAMVHTPIDCRVATASKVYRSKDAAPTMAEATAGVDPGPVTSRRFAAMPPFSRSFEYNGILYAVNAADKRFLQYSEPRHYDLWNLGDGHMGHATAIMDAGSVPGVMVTTHANGVTVYAGTSMADFTKKFYPCLPIAGTLYSGLLTPAIGHGHLFLAQDGVYLVNVEGLLVRLTGEKFTHAGGLNTSYSAATVEGGKYLAYGNTVCVDLDIDAKAVTKRAPNGVVAATNWNDVAYLATGSTIKKHSGLATLAASATLPFSTLGADGVKAFIDLYFTGRIDGVATITATGTEGRSWSVTVDSPGTVYNYRVKVPKGFVGNHIQVKIETTSGVFRMERLRAVFNDSRRNR